MNPTPLTLGLAALLPLPALAQHAMLLPEPPPLADAAAPAVQGLAQIEVVFVLDTTGSMSGLIDGAKRKIWSIANVIATATPRPQIRMGLVAYRDRGDSYITQVTPLTDDIDKLYSDLMGLRADGGDDTPESVNQALHEALTSIQWLSGPAARQPGVLQVMYLVGDCPPHMDYKDDVKYTDTCQAAASRGIVINTIQCGSDGDTTPIWQAIARSAEGQFFQVEQSGGVISISTPFDGDLARLGSELEATLIDYGDPTVLAAQSEKREVQSRLAVAAPSDAAADRASYNASAAGAKNLYGAQELVQDVLDGKVKLKDVPDSQLPEAMRALSLADREQYVQTRAQQRVTIRAQVDALTIQRDNVIKAELAKAGADGADSFDQSVVKALRDQAHRRGIQLSGDAK